MAENLVSAIDEDLELFQGLLDEGEKNALTRAVGVTDTEQRGFLRSSQLKRCFDHLGIQFSGNLLNILKLECSGSVNDQYSMKDIVHIYTSWKTVSSTMLASSGDWADSAAVKQANSTQLFLNDSAWRTAWNLFFMTCALVHWYLVLYRDYDEKFGRSFSVTYLLVDSFLTLVYTADMYLWLNTAWIGATVVDDKEKVWAAYLRTWFVPDLISTLPFDIILYSAGATISAGIFSHLRLIKTIRALAIWGISGYVPLTTWNVRFYSQVLPLLNLFYSAAALLQVFAVIFLMIAEASGHTKYLGRYSYMTALYFVVQTATTVGYGDIPLSSIGELWFSVVLVCVSLLLNGLIIGRLVTILQLASAKSIPQDKLRETLAVLEFFDIPKQLQVEILNFQSYVLWSNPGSTFNNIISTVLPPISQNIDLLRRVGALNTIPQFNDINQAALISMAKMLEIRTLRPEEYVSLAEEPHRGLRILLFGFVDKLDHNGRYLLTHKTGDHFGVQGLFDRSPEEFTYKALSYCEMLVLSAEHFLAVMSQHPFTAREIRQKLHKEQACASNAEISPAETSTEQLAALRTLLSQMKDLKARLSRGKM